jgi:atypical dual specificity phosphatase
MREQIAKGGKVYVHCKAGRGRSATVVLCWLVDAKNMTPDEAQSLLFEKRPHVNKHLADRQVVQEFFARRCRNS